MTYRGHTVMRTRNARIGTPREPTQTESSRGHASTTTAPSLFGDKPLSYTNRPHIINSLHKFGPSLNPTTDGQIISLDILEVIRKWEDKMRLVREGSSMDEDGPADETPEWVTPLHFREAVISFLTRASCSLQEPNARTIGVGRALTLMRNFLRLPAWSDVNFKLDYFRKVLCEVRYLS